MVAGQIRIALALLTLKLRATIGRVPLGIVQFVLGGDIWDLAAHIAGFIGDKLRECCRRPAILLIHLALVVNLRDEHIDILVVVSGGVEAPSNLWTATAAHVGRQSVLLLLVAPAVTPASRRCLGTTPRTFLAGATSQELQLLVTHTLTARYIIRPSEISTGRSGAWPHATLLNFR